MMAFLNAEDILWDDRNVGTIDDIGLPFELDWSQPPEFIDVKSPISNGIVRFHKVSLGFDRVYYEAQIPGLQNGKTRRAGFHIQKPEPDEIDIANFF